MGSSGDSLSDPAETVIEPLAGEGTTGLYVPIMFLDAVEGKGVGDLSRRHRLLEVLLVCEDEHGRMLEVIVPQDSKELVLHDGDPCPVRAVDHHDHSMSASEVRRP